MPGCERKSPRRNEDLYERKKREGKGNRHEIVQVEVDEG